MKNVSAPSFFPSNIVEFQLLKIVTDQTATAQIDVAKDRAVRWYEPRAFRLGNDLDRCVSEGSFNGYVLQKFGVVYYDLHRVGKTSFQFDTCFDNHVREV